MRSKKNNNNDFWKVPKNIIALLDLTLDLMVIFTFEHSMKAGVEKLLFAHHRKFLRIIDFSFRIPRVLAFLLI